MQHRHQLLPAAWNRHHAEIQALANEITLTLGNEQRQRKNTSERRKGLRIPKRDALAGCRLTGAEIKERGDDRAHQDLAAIVTHGIVILATMRIPYCFGSKSWLGNADASGGTLMTMNGWLVVAWQLLQPSVRRP